MERGKSPEKISGSPALAWEDKRKTIIKKYDAKTAELNNSIADLTRRIRNVEAEKARLESMRRSELQNLRKEETNEN